MPRYSSCFAVLCFAATCLTGSRAALAAWSNDPTVNTALCTAAGNQDKAQLLSDGSGGAMIVWEDARGGNYDIYMQHLDSAGTAQWAANGVAVCTAADSQVSPQLISDGSGGVIVAWQDNRSGSNYDIYVQRVDSTGVAQWTANGVAVCTATGSQYVPELVSDGSGGAIITWYDYRNGNNDVYAQRVDSAGAVQWATNGVAVCTAAGDQFTPELVSDGSGGAIITWYDSRSGNRDVYAQRVNSTGTAQWTANGVAVCTAAGSQDVPKIISDGLGGAVIVWQDVRSGRYDIYVQRLDSAGAAQWTADGAAICTAANDQETPRLVSDGSAGAVITWYDRRGGTNWDIYAQRVNSMGTAQWTANGVAVCTAAGNISFDSRRFPQITSDGSAGAIIAWCDWRSGSRIDVYAQRVDSAGAVQWMVNGIAVCTAAGDKNYPQLASDGSGGAIITWNDFRGGATSDAYAQHISSGGLLPVTLSRFRIE